MSKTILLFGSCNYPGLGHPNDKPSGLILAYTLDRSNGTLIPLPDGAFHTGDRNPSFVCVTADGSHAYCVDEKSGEGHLMSFEVDSKSGNIRKQLNVVNSEGEWPCYCVLDSTDKWLFAANYLGGTIASFPVLTDGKLGPAADSKHHTGVIVPEHKDRQDASHPHMVKQHPVYKDYIFMADLGFDRLWVYKFDVKTGGIIGSGKDPIHLQFKRGVGPRHFDFHPKKPDIMYVHHELSGTTSVVRLITSNNGNSTQIKGTEEIQQLSSLAPGKSCSRGPHLGGSDIHVSSDGKFLYCINRTDETIAIFSIDDKTGLLSLKSHVPTKGKISRNFEIISGDPNDFLVLVNQESKNVVVYLRNKLNGLLTNPSIVEFPTWPTCVAVINTKLSAL